MLTVMSRSEEIHQPQRPPCHAARACFVYLGDSGLMARQLYVMILVLYGFRIHCDLIGAQSSPPTSLSGRRVSEVFESATLV